MGTPYPFNIAPNQEKWNPKLCWLEPSTLYSATPRPFWMDLCGQRPLTQEKKAQPVKFKNLYLPSVGSILQVEFLCICSGCWQA